MDATRFPRGSVRTPSPSHPTARVPSSNGDIDSSFDSKCKSVNNGAYIII